MEVQIIVQVALVAPFMTLARGNPYSITTRRPNNKTTKQQNNQTTRPPNNKLLYSVEPLTDLLDDGGEVGYCLGAEHGYAVLAEVGYALEDCYGWW